MKQYIITYTHGSKTDICCFPESDAWEPQPRYLTPDKKEAEDRAAQMSELFPDTVYLVKELV